MATVAIPGQVLGPVSSYVSGPGTHIVDSQICASIIGPVLTAPDSTSKGKPTITVVRSLNSGKETPGKESNDMLPALEDVVICQVSRVQQRQIVCSIILINPDEEFAAVRNLSHIPSNPDEVRFQAILRKEDVRMTEKDRIVMNEMFRIGDFVRAQIINLGDEKSFYVSTAGNEFGVIMAKSEGGKSMVPRSWKDMLDADSGKVEPRKVAKPV